MEKIELRNISPDSAMPLEPEKRYEANQVGPGKRVVMHFELTLGDGTVVDSNFSGAPVTFSIGDGNLLPGFEQSIYGLTPGQEQTSEIPAGNAFGQRSSENIQQFPRYRFPADLVLEKGLMIDFADMEGNSQPGVIIDFNAEKVSVDFNHPLAGRDIMFRVKILDVRLQS